MTVKNWTEFKAKFKTEEHAKIAAASQALRDVIPLLGPERMLIEQANLVLHNIAYRGIK